MTAIDALRAELDGASDADRRTILDRFWEVTAARTPLVHARAETPGERDVTFVWRDDTAAAVLLTVNRIVDDLDASRMQRIPQTDVWHLTMRLDADWRGTYSVLAVDATRLGEIERMEPRWAMRTVREHGATDPRNPHTTGTHGGTASVAALPDAMPQPWLAGRGPARGELSEHLAPGGRRVWIYRPAGIDETTPHPLVVLLDGEVWHRTGDAFRAIDALVDADAIRPPSLLLVDAEGSPRRMTDLSVDGTMSSEIVDVLLPWVRTMLPISADPRDIVVSGESLGGLTALKTAFDHPMIVGAALAQSSSLWQHDMRARAAASAPVRLFLTAGAHERGLVEANRVLVDDLRGLPHEHRYVEFNGGHDMAWWRGLWADGVRHLLGR